MRTILANPISWRSEPLILLCRTKYWLLSWIHVCIGMRKSAKFMFVLWCRIMCISSWRHWKFQTLDIIRSQQYFIALKVIHHQKQTDWWIGRESFGSGNISTESSVRNRIDLKNGMIFEPILFGMDWLNSWRSIRFCMKRIEGIDTHRLEADAPLIDAPLLVVYQREVHCHRFRSITMYTESRP